MKNSQVLQHDVVQLDEYKELVAHLRAVSLFSGLKENEAALIEFAKSMQEKIFKPSEQIIQEGEQSCELFIMISGTACVFKTTPEGDKFKVAILNSSDHAFFGEGSLIDSELRSATITAESECKCLVLNRDSFENLSRQSPDWTLPFYQKISSLVLARLRKSNNDLLLLYKALVAEIRGDH